MFNNNKKLGSANSSFPLQSLTSTDPLQNRNQSSTQPSFSPPEPSINPLPQQVLHIDIPSLYISPNIHLRPTKPLELTLYAELVEHNDPLWIFVEIAAWEVLEVVGAVGVFGCKPNAAFAVEVVEGAHLCLFRGRLVDLGVATER